MLIHEHVDVDQEVMAKIFSFKNDEFKKIIPLHFHQSVEIIYCVAGSLVVDVGQKTSILKSGDIIVINPNVAHETKSIEKNHVIVLQIKSTFYNHQTHTIKLNTSRITVDSEVLSIIQNIMISMKAINCKKLPYYQYLMQSQLSLLKYYLLDHFLIPLSEDELSEMPTVNNKIYGILQYIQSHFTEDISLAQIAEFSEYTIPYLSKYFKKRTGITVLDYIYKLRLERAIYLMKTTDKTLLDISLEAGFPNMQSFRTRLKKEFDVTPREYLNALKLDKR
ncbi:AraC family transcriptional regulator [Vagococcus lutrae]|uniref:AraC family transcriptional regulator n=1 Tax=Vagococcus lutrae TaxID=81947 RepID=UPI00200C7ADB|nr:AraC family transcriptional regulator [Vagococcus lutrae]UQF11051.1 AraC family transcriptional regulator [Vagococcus lutrae]UQF70257.1 AraC family transcriptional regulator [Vagococcus lutrae]WEB81290.1 AraC family transcriptional regulator [Vagococcus lutrae]